MSTNRLYLFYGCILSLTLLVALFAMRLYQPTLLDIDVKWLVVAALPILIALVVGRFIHGFKGFGVELSVAAEAAKPIISSQSIKKNVESIEPTGVMEKLGIEALENIPEVSKQKVTVLTFVLGKFDYYKLQVVKEYLRKLPNVKYFAVVDQNHEFIALVPLPENGEKSRKDQFISSFLRMIEENSLTNFNFSYSKEYVPETETVIDTLRLLHRSVHPFIAVVNKEMTFVGYATETSLQKALADAVLKDYDNKQG
ncbi:hypothetical protein [Paraflavitalea pollutisoli]|uniref:hypothetical protein n=1 Tax=Paraflavitalea pollutisoli TaxID=3034143 RepID=UPI0023EBAB0B|nr:hypothetical protein [Paraflavitalea sp. H1-2-19X]